MALGIAFDADGIAVCEARRRGRRVEVRRAGRAPLPPGALVPSLGGPNVLDAAACGAALGVALAEAGARPVFAALAIPDPAVRVRVLPLGVTGGTREERARLTAWRLRDSLPFPPAEARADSVSLAGAGVLAVVASAAVVSGYEDLVRRRGQLPLHVGPASLALWTLIEAEPPFAEGRPGALVVAEPGHVTLLAAEGGRPRAWRCLQRRGEADAALARELADSLHALVDDGALSTMPAVHLQAGAAPGAVAQALRDELGRPVEPLPRPEGLPAEALPLAAAGAALAMEGALRWR